MYLIIGKALVGHIEESSESKYLVSDCKDENKEVLKKYTELWDGNTETYLKKKKTWREHGKKQVS